MKNQYLNGLYRLFHSIGNPDPELGVMFCVILMQIFLILDISIIFQFRIPLSEELGNKWLVRLISGSILWLINKYIFGIRESVYSEYPPLSKRTTLLITLLYFAVTIGFLFYASKHRSIKHIEYTKSVFQNTYHKECQVLKRGSVSIFIYSYSHIID